jgi:ribosomal protein S27AE
MNELYYCPDCGFVQDPEDLAVDRELMDPSVPGSWQEWWACGRCGSSAIEEMTREWGVGLVLQWSQRLDQSKPWRHGSPGHKEVQFLRKDLSALHCWIEEQE